MTSDLISVTEAAKIIGVERQVAYRYIRQGKLPAEKIAGLTVVRRSDAERVEPGRRGWAPKKYRDDREWTRAMTLKRLEVWNEAVSSGTFDDPKTGKVDAERIKAWEIEQGWTRSALLEAAEGHFDNRVNG